MRCLDESSIPARSLVVEWWDAEAVHHRSTVGDTETAAGVLEAAGRAGVPLMVDFIAEDGASLTVGCGAADVPLCFQASNDPPYYRSRGDGQSDALQAFLYSGAESEFRDADLVPVATAAEAVREFFRTGCRPDNVDWEEV
jgi:hypothetical protein